MQIERTTWPWVRDQPTSSRRLLESENSADCAWRLGAPQAITAMAHTLTRLVCRMLKYGGQHLGHGDELRRREVPGARDPTAFRRRRRSQPC